MRLGRHSLADAPGNAVVGFRATWGFKGVAECACRIQMLGRSTSARYSFSYLINISCVPKGISVRLPEPVPPIEFFFGTEIFVIDVRIEPGRYLVDILLLSP